MANEHGNLAAQDLVVTTVDQLYEVKVDQPYEVTEEDLPWWW